MKYILLKFQGETVVWAAPMPSLAAAAKKLRGMKEWQVLRWDPAKKSFKTLTKIDDRTLARLGAWDDLEH